MFRKNLVCCLVCIVFLALAAFSPAPKIQPIPASLLSQPQTVTVVFLLADSQSDQGWNAAHFRGILELKTLGQVIPTTGDNFDVKLHDGKMLSVKIVENVGYNDADIERTTRSVIAKFKPKLIFGTWFNAAGTFAKLSKKYPDVLFEHCSGYPMIESNGKNLSTYFIRQEQGDYVAGYVVGLLGQSKVGLVGTFPISEPVRAVNAFTLGLQRGLTESGRKAADAEVNTVWLGTWLDPVKEASAANSFLGQGYNVIRQLSDTPYASQTACEKGKGVIAVGYGTDVSNSAKCAVVTNEWAWGSYYVAEVKAVLDGKWKAQDWWGGFPEGVVQMSGWNVPADVKVKAEKVVSDFTSGKKTFCGPIEGYGKDGPITIPAGKCMGDMGELTMQFFVKGVKSELPSKPENGYELYLESTK